MDKRLICGLFGHFLTEGNSGFWAETGVSVQCGGGFCREDSTLMSCISMVFLYILMVFISI
jgi:hypothetical protein